MYGFGSKKALIEDFASTALTAYSVIVINGYLQSINLKQVQTSYDKLITLLCIMCLVLLSLYCNSKDCVSSFKGEYVTTL